MKKPILVYLSLSNLLLNVLMLVQLVLLSMKYITLVRVFSYNVEHGAECGCGNSD